MSYTPWLLEATSNYGPLKKGVDYFILDEGRDWYLASCNGKGVYVFKWVFERDKSKAY